MEATKNITQTPFLSKLCADLDKEEPMPAKSKTGSGKTQERNKDLQKTKMCVYYLQGKCGLGTSCKFAHSSDEMRKAPNLHKTGLCANFMKGQCNKENCTFAHGEEELVKPPSYKKAMCIWFRQGKCRNGASCGFVHHLSELRGELLETEPKPPPGLAEVIPEKPLKPVGNVNDCDASTDVPSESQAETVASDVSTAAGSKPDEHLFRMMAGRGSAPLEQQVKTMSLAIGQLQAKLSQVQARQEAVSDRLEGETLKNQVKELQYAINKLSKQCQGTEAQLRGDVVKPAPRPPAKKARPVPTSPTYRSVKAPAPAKPSYQFEMKAAIGVLLVAALVMVELYLPK